jgi:hypothetical protein
VGFDDRLTDGQTRSRAPGFGGKETVENSMHHCGIESGPGVLDLDHSIASRTDARLDLRQAGSVHNVPHRFDSI